MMTVNEQFLELEDQLDRLAAAVKRVEQRLERLERPAKTKRQSGKRNEQ
jgi:ubiquinone biosynthesis protein UbiJ